MQSGHKEGKMIPAYSEPKEALDVIYQKWRCIDEGRVCEIDALTVRQAYNTAIQALEKQIPKEPFKNIIHYPHRPDMEIVQCPTCGRRIRTKSSQDKHCPDCGQAILWREHD